MITHYVIIYKKLLYYAYARELCELNGSMKYFYKIPEKIYMNEEYDCETEYYMNNKQSSAISYNLHKAKAIFL